MEKLSLAFVSLLTFNLMLPVNSRHKTPMLNKNQEEQYDGPYIRYAGDMIYINYLMKSGGTKVLKTESIPLHKKNNVSLKVITDIPGKSFQVHLKKELKNEESEFPPANKMVVLSDIEGNFAALRKLLQACNVIDEDFAWRFGDGHLVLLGDFFDRGDEVTEILWFIYYLEENAKARGGYVHFILGNHEIMNLSGDLRYLNQKYMENANFLRQEYVTFYDETTELGRWLRTKNIIEKIGDLVFVHGGISDDVNRMKASIQGINKLTRLYYADTSSTYIDEKSGILLGDLGPYWYRGYYEQNKGIPLQIDHTLSQFGAKHIVTGHSIVSDTISVWYDGRLLNTDVHHAAGNSEALLIENDKYYRVNPAGKKVLLMEAIKQKK